MATRCWMCDFAKDKSVTLHGDGFHYHGKTGLCRCKNRKWRGEVIIGKDGKYHKARKDRWE